MKMNMNFMFLQRLGQDQLVYFINVLIMVLIKYLIFMDYGQVVNKVGHLNAKKFNLQNIILILLLNKISTNIGIVNIILIGLF